MELNNKQVLIENRTASVYLRDKGQMKINDLLNLQGLVL